MGYVVGIDEVGRGCLAGPVYVCAVRVPRGWRPRIPGRVLRDSKQLTRHGREEWFECFVNHPQISYALARVSPNVIDRINISRAANVAALRAFRKLLKQQSVPYAIRHKPFARVYLDGGLYLGNGRARLAATTVIKGDEKITAIKIASIIAKVSRDRYMARLAKKFPNYGFEIHKGYGTRAHYAAIRTFGVSTAHRKTFIEDFA